MERGGYVYIMTNITNSTLYIGVTSDLKVRVWQHKNKEYPNSFTSRYKLFKLVYYEGFSSIEEAIYREKQLKGWSRAKKIKLIENLNPEWEDLFDKLDV
jgi:putative endonuclease